MVSGVSRARLLYGALLALEARPDPKAYPAQPRSGALPVLEGLQGHEALAAHQGLEAFLAFQDDQDDLGSQYLCLRLSPQCALGRRSAN